MAFLDSLKELIAGDEETPRRYRRLREEGGGTATGAMLQSDINRGVLPGSKSAWSKGLDPEALAKTDRYAWGKQAGLGGIPVVAAYEALKSLGGAPGLSSVSGALFGDTGRDFFKQDENTSPASLGNVGAYIRGAASPDETASFPEKLKQLLIGR